MKTLKVTFWILIGLIFLAFIIFGIVSCGKRNTDQAHQAFLEEYYPNSRVVPIPGYTHDHEYIVEDDEGNILFVETIQGPKIYSAFTAITDGKRK